MSSPIGIFDSGYGGLTVFKSIQALLPQYDYLYLGDNARAPYGPRSFETVYEYTLSGVRWMLAQGCPLVILACNTASARALRSIQQRDLPALGAQKRVLGIIRPTAEVIGSYTNTGAVGILGTRGTVLSGSYEKEIAHFAPQVQVFGEACPMWVSLVEAGEHESAGADFFVQQHLDNLLLAHPEIDTVLLACTHYPLLLPKIEEALPAGVRAVAQGPIVAASLQDYLDRHPELEGKISTGSAPVFYTTEKPGAFDGPAGVFWGAPVASREVDLG